jgi:hypothetical protein
MGLCSQLPWAFNVTLPCRDISSLPNITFSIGGRPFAVPFQAYAYQVCRGGGAAAGDGVE